MIASTIDQQSSKLQRQQKQHDQTLRTTGQHLYWYFFFRESAGMECVGFGNI